MKDIKKLISPENAEELYMFFMRRVGSWSEEGQLARQTLEDLLSKLREKKEPTTANNDEPNTNTN